MSRELEILAREFRNEPATVMRTELNLYQTNILTAAAPFLKKVEQECKQQKEGRGVLIAIIRKCV